MQNPKDFGFLSLSLENLILRCLIFLHYHCGRPWRSQKLFANQTVTLKPISLRYLADPSQIFDFRSYVGNQRREVNHFVENQTFLQNHCGFVEILTWHLLIFQDFRFLLWNPSVVNQNVLLNQTLLRILVNPIPLLI